MTVNHMLGKVHPGFSLYPGLCTCNTYLVDAEQFYFSIIRDYGLAGFGLINDEPDVVFDAAKYCAHGIAQRPFEPVAP